MFAWLAWSSSTSLPLTATPPRRSTVPTVVGQDAVDTTYFGEFLAVGGDRIVVGAYEWPGQSAGHLPGAAFLYRFDNDTSTVELLDMIENPDNKVAVGSVVVEGWMGLLFACLRATS